MAHPSIRKRRIGEALSSFFSAGQSHIKSAFSIAAESAAGRAPRLGNCEPVTEQLRTDGGQLDRADPGGTALYSIRVMAEYTMRYDT